MADYSHLIKKLSIFTLRHMFSQISGQNNAVDSLYKVLQKLPKLSDIRNFCKLVEPLVLMQHETEIIHLMLTPRRANRNSSYRPITDYNHNLK